LELLPGPTLEPPVFWEDLYEELAARLKFEEKTLEEAVREVWAFTGAINGAGAQ
jgi:hypothetical protein